MIQKWQQTNLNKQNVSTQQTQRKLNRAEQKSTKQTKWIINILLLCLHFEHCLTGWKFCCEKCQQIQVFKTTGCARQPYTSFYQDFFFFFFFICFVFHLNKNKKENIWLDSLREKKVVYKNKSNALMFVSFRLFFFQEASSMRSVSCEMMWDVSVEVLDSFSISTVFSTVVLVLENVILLDE